MKRLTPLTPLIFVPVAVFGDTTARVASVVALAILAAILWAQHRSDARTMGQAIEALDSSRGILNRAGEFAENAEERHRVVATFASAVSTAAANAAKELAPYDQLAARRSLNELRDALAYLEEHYPEVST